MLFAVFFTFCNVQSECSTASFLCRCRRLAGKRHSVWGLSEGECMLSLLATQYLINRLWEFHKIYNCSAVGGEDELIIFWGRKVKVTTRMDVVRKAEFCSQVSATAFLTKGYSSTVHRGGSSSFVLSLCPQNVKDITISLSLVVHTRLFSSTFVIISALLSLSLFASRLWQASSYPSLECQPYNSKAGWGLGQNIWIFMYADETVTSVITTSFLSPAFLQEMWLWVV